MSVTHTLLGVSLALMLLAVGLTNIPTQLANASIELFDICKTAPEACEGVTLPWWWWIFCPGCPEGFNLEDILTIPENQSFSISVRHGPTSDTIMMEIPKALSSSILNQSTGFDPQQQSPMVQSN
jgi:hypothetical protein